MSRNKFLFRPTRALLFAQIYTIVYDFKNIRNFEHSFKNRRTTIKKSKKKKKFSTTRNFVASKQCIAKSMVKTVHCRLLSPSSP